MGKRDAKATEAQAKQALANAATALRRGISAQRRALHEVKAAEEAVDLGMRLHINDNDHKDHGRSQ